MSWSRPQRGSIRSLKARVTPKAYGKIKPLVRASTHWYEGGFSDKQVFVTIDQVNYAFCRSTGAIKDRRPNPRG